MSSVLAYSSSRSSASRQNASASFQSSTAKSTVNRPGAYSAGNSASSADGHRGSAEPPVS